MIALAVIRKVTPEGCILLGCRLIADNKLDELFQLKGKTMADVFSEGFTWVLPLEIVALHGCPAFLLPNWKFKETEDIGNPITTMLYPIPLCEEFEIVLNGMNELINKLDVENIFSTLSIVFLFLEKLRFFDCEEFVITRIFSEILTFCFALPIPKVIPFGTSESDFWTDELRDIYKRTEF